MKKILVVTMLIVIALCVLSGCGSGKKAEAKAELDKVQTQLDEKFEEIDSIIGEHTELWERLYAKEGDAENDIDDGFNSIYTGYMTKLIDKYSDQLTKDEKTALEEDVERIRKIEGELKSLYEQYDKLSKKAGLDEDVENPKPEKFPEFKGKDLNGNAIDSSIFKANKVTVINFWFNACSPCVGELGDLNELNDKLKEKGGAVIGINTDTLDGNEDQIKEAKRILEEKGAKYPNIWVTSDSELGKFSGKIIGFPTTYVVDNSGSIVGDPLMEGINNPESMEKLQALIDKALSDSTKP